MISGIELQWTELIIEIVDESRQTIKPQETDTREGIKWKLKLLCGLFQLPLAKSFDELLFDRTLSINYSFTKKPQIILLEPTTHKYVVIHSVLCS